MVSQSRRDRQLTVAVSERAERCLTERAAAAGQSVPDYVSDLVERTSSLPASLDEVLHPVRDAFSQSGMSDDDLGDFLEGEIHAARAERRRRSS